MARLPDYASLGQTPTPQTPLAVARIETQPLDFNVRQGPGEAAIRGGREVTAAGNQMQDRIDTLYAQDATNQAQQVKLALKDDPNQGFKYVEGKDALTPDFLPSYGKKFDNAVQEISKTLPNEHARTLFMQHAQVLSLQHTSDLMTHRATQFEKWADKTDSDAIDAARQEAANSITGADRDTALMKMRTVYARLGDRKGLPTEADFRKQADGAVSEYYQNLSAMDPVLALKAFQADHADNNLTISDPKARLVAGKTLFVSAAPVLANEIANDPALTKVLMNPKKELGPETHTGHEIVDLLPDDEKMHVLALARTQMHQNNAQARADLMDRLKDGHAMAAVGRVLPVGFLPTQDEIVAIEGPEKGRILYRDMVLGTMNLQSSMQAIQGLDRRDQTAIVRAASGAGSDEDRATLERTLKATDRHIAAISQIAAPEAGAGFANAVVRQRILVGAVQNIWGQQDADPAGYVVQSSPSISGKLTAAMGSVGGDPIVTRKAFEDYASAALAEQDRLGMPKRTIVPGSVAQGIVNQFYSSKDGGQNAAQTISQLSSQWGKAWPMVYAQVSKDIPGSAVVIGSGMNPNSAAAANLVTAGNMKTTELKEGVPHDVSTGISKLLPEVMTDFRLSLAQTVGGNALFNTFSDQTEKLALMYARQGKKDHEAVKQAYEDVIGSRYTFVANTNTKSPYMIPKGVDETDVVRGADQVLRDVDKLDLAIPTSRAGLNEQQRKDAYISAVKSSGYWVNAPNDYGLVLYANGAAVLDKNGNPIIRSWYYLQKTETQDPMFPDEPTPTGTTAQEPMKLSGTLDSVNPNPAPGKKKPSSSGSSAGTVRG